MRERLLVRLPSWLGDLVSAEPTLRAIWEVYAADGQEGRISLAGPGGLLALFDRAFPGSRRIPHAGRGGERVGDWRGHDCALLLTGSFRSAWTAWRAGIPRRVGWARDGRSPLLTEGMRPALERGRTPLGVGVHGRRPRYLPRPFGETCVELAGLLGVPVGDSRPRLGVAPAAAEAVRRRLEAEGIDPKLPLVVANVGARPRSAKGYPPRLWGQVLAALAADGGVEIVLVGGPGEEAALRETVAAAGDARMVPLVDPVADLAQLCALSALARVFLTADGGPRHVAGAVGTAIVCVLGPTDPRHSADHGERTRALRREVPCGPCHRERCPLSAERAMACMLEVEPRRLAAAARELLGRGRPVV